MQKYWPLLIYHEQTLEVIHATVLLTEVKRLLLFSYTSFLLRAFGEV